MKGWVVLSSALRVLMVSQDPAALGPWQEGLLISGDWAVWAKPWVLGTLSQILTTSLGNVQPSRLDFFLRPPPAPTTEKQCWWKMPLWEFNLYGKHFIFVSKSPSLCRVFPFAFSKDYFSLFFSSKILIKKLDAFTKNGYLFLPLHPFLHS